MDASVLDKICMENDSPTTKALKGILYENVSNGDNPKLKKLVTGFSKYDSEDAKEALKIIVDTAYNVFLTRLAISTGAYDTHRDATSGNRVLKQLSHFLYIETFDKEYVMLESLNKYLNIENFTANIQDTRTFLEKYSGVDINYRTTAQYSQHSGKKTIMKIIPADENKDNYKVSVELLEDALAKS